jgi:hypothetical protein
LVANAHNIARMIPNISQNQNSYIASENGYTDGERWLLYAEVCA